MGIPGSGPKNAFHDALCRSPEWAMKALLAAGQVPENSNARAHPQIKRLRYDVHHAENCLLPLCKILAPGLQSEVIRPEGIPVTPSGS